MFPSARGAASTGVTVPLKYSRQRLRSSAFIGRVGALALFLGVGAAMAMPAVAHADSESSDSSTSSSANSSSNSVTQTPNSKAGPGSDGGTTSSAKDGTEDSDTGSAAAAHKDSQGDLDDDIDDDGIDNGGDLGDSDAESDADADADVEPVTAEPTTTVELDNLVTDVISSAPGSGTDPAMPVRSPASWVLVGSSPRNGVEDDPEAMAAGTAVTTELTDDLPGLVAGAVTAATPVTETVTVGRPSLLEAVGDLLFSIAPYTVTALNNVARMVFETPLETLVNPFRAVFFAVESLTRGVLTDIGLLPKLQYANTGWVTLHGDPGNRKEQLGVTPADDYSRWEALLGASVLAAPTILPNGNIVVTTGVAAGASNLHIIDPEGRIVWQSTPWSGNVGVDSAAVLSSPIIDRKGNIFVSDGDQLWSFTQSGDLRWVTNLPSPPADNPFKPGSRNINPFITATLTNDGSVLGVTVFGQVVVIDSATGRYTAPIYQIPGPLAPAVTSNPPAPLWANGFMDPEIIDPIWQVAYGGIVRSANTPGIEARTGRVIVAATDEEEGLGALYAFKYLPPTPFSAGRILLDWKTQMGPGSGSSPTITNDGRFVYASDNDGFLYAFRTSNGTLAWKTQSNAEAASVAVDRRANTYVLTRNNVMSSFDAKGNHRWNADTGSLLSELPVSAMWGAPVAIGAGNPTVVRGAIVQAVVLGYNVSLAPIGVPQVVFVPVKSSLATFDPETGIAQRVLADTSEGTEGILNIAPSGMIYASIGAFTTTSLLPLAPYLNSVLPAGYSLLQPTGGVNGFTRL